MIVLSQRDVVALLPMKDCIEVMAGALGALARGESQVPLRTMMRLPPREQGRAGNQPDIFAMMPAYVGAPAAVGAKVISVFPGNHGTQFDSHQGAVLLFDATTGALQAVVDATAITAIRTAAVSALATRLLAREGAADLAIIGSGVQARQHLQAISLVRKIERIRIWSRNKDNARALRDRFAPAAEVVNRAEDAVRDASIVCVATSATEPVVHGDWISPGTHLNVVGTATPRAREVDTALVRKARLFVDSRVSALKEPGDIIIPLEEGAITPDHIVAEIGELVAGSKTFERQPGDITLFKSLGLAVEDVASAQFIFARAVERGAGVMVDLGGSRDAD